MTASSPDKNLNSAISAESITHQHLAAVINTYISKNYSLNKCIRILDLGCGNAKLICFFQKAFQYLQPNINIELYGLDIYDGNHQLKGYMDKAQELLISQHPGILWGQRIKYISQNQQWTFQTNYFDFIISNQVMEHVDDHHFVLSEIYRTLKKGGRSIHLFPLKSYIMEGHAHIPFVHKFSDRKNMARCIFVFLLLGFRKGYYLSKESNNNKRPTWSDMKKFSKKYAITLSNNTNYLTYTELCSLATNNRLVISTNYTKMFYISKLLSYFNVQYYLYGNPFMEKLTFSVLKYIQGCTIHFSKSN